MSEQIITSESLNVDLQAKEDAQEDTQENSSEKELANSTDNVDNLEDEENTSEEDNGSEDETDEDSADEAEPETEDTEEPESASDNDGKLPKWMEKRLIREKNKHRREMDAVTRELSEYKQTTGQQLNQYGVGVNNAGSYIDPQTQIQDPFTGKIVDINSVEGQVVTKLQQMSQVQVEQETQAKKQTAQQNLKQKLEKGYDKFEDFGEVVNSIPISQAMLEAAYLSDNTDELLYNLAKYKPEEVERVSKLSPERQFKEMILLEQKMKSSTKRKIVAKVPEISSKIKGSGSIKRDPEKMNFDDLLSMRREQQRKKLRR